MMNALYTAATGMSAQQTSMDVIANNLANVNTSGFKSTRLTFDDLLYQQTGSRQAARDGAQVGMGVAPASTAKVWQQGELKETGQPTSLAIKGPGLFRVQVGNQIGFTRDGDFTVDATGQLVTSKGFRVVPAITIPTNVDSRSINISANGTVTAGEGGQARQLGQIQIANFTNPAGLQAAGDNLYMATTNSGAPQVGVPGTGGRGSVVQGYTETSNVSVMEEMINMISAQRAFESVSKVISSSDEMLGIANAMRR